MILVIASGLAFAFGAAGARADGLAVANQPIIQVAGDTNPRGHFSGGAPIAPSVQNDTNPIVDAIPSSSAVAPSVQNDTNPVVSATAKSSSSTVTPSGQNDTNPIVEATGGAIAPADLQVVGISGETVVNRGESVAYSTTIVNRGGPVYHDAQVVITIQGPLQLVGTVSMLGTLCTQGAGALANTITCAHGSFAAGDLAIIEFHTQVVGAGNGALISVVADPTRASAGTGFSNNAQSLSIAIDS